MNTINPETAALLAQLAAEMPTLEEQYEQCRLWRDILRAGGYKVYCDYGLSRPDLIGDREWKVYATNALTLEENHVATIDIDGCGASWHGPDAIWKVIERGLRQRDQW